MKLKAASLLAVLAILSHSALAGNLHTQINLSSDQPTTVTLPGTRAMTVVNLFRFAGDTNAENLVITKGSETFPLPAASLGGASNGLDKCINGPKGILIAGPATISADAVGFLSRLFFSYKTSARPSTLHTEIFSATNPGATFKLRADQAMVIHHFLQSGGVDHDGFLTIYKGTANIPVQAVKLGINDYYANDVNGPEGITIAGPAKVIVTRNGSTKLLFTYKIVPN